MIYDLFEGNNEAYDAMYDILGSEFEFYMTGSRYFGGASPSSDYDLFVEYSDRVVHFLESLNFVHQACNGDIVKYSDISVSCIMGLYLPYDIKSQMEPLVHVQLIHSDMMYVKKTVNKFFKDHPSYLRNDGMLSKMQARNTWQSMMFLVHKVHNETKEQLC